MEEKINNDEDSSNIGKIINIINRLFKFAGSSIISAVVDLSIFTVLTNEILFSIPMNVMEATIISRIFSGSLNFFLSQRWVFNGVDRVSDVIKYILLVISQMFCSGFLVSILSTKFIDATFIKIFVDIALFFLSYLIQRFVFYRYKIKK
ncbi:putative membrane protein [Clostridium bornimense]|uniref:Putative membrane protein n=1 Tax=Clostridium bornimense TaxID=1216932 RepID=W6RZ65_9CLOT|nr:GtrA family protein [Clostridium bornimense]CDM69916.1 putative membrane protein [Clostridium bornimense]